MRAFARDLARCLDFSTLERLPASFVTENLGQRDSDMLWRIQTAEGGWFYVLVLLEFQSTIDRRMALRMLDYTVRVLRGLGNDDLGRNSEYPAVLPIVIYNGERRWDAATNINDLFGAVPEELLGYLPRHRYLLIDNSWRVSGLGSPWLWRRGSDLPARTWDCRSGHRRKER